MKKIFKTFNTEIKSTDEEKREIVMVGSKEVIDRDGDVVKIDGIDLKNFKKNPVILFGHDHRGLPVGRATKVWKEDKKLMFNIKFPTPEEYSFADTVYKLIKGNFLNSSSIGFAPNWEKAERNEKAGGYIFNESELLELSIVPVPANPLALVQSKGVQKALAENVIDDLELNEMELYLKQLVDEQTDEILSDEDIEKYSQEIVDEFEIEQEIEKTEQTITKCASCGHELVCPECNKDFHKDSDSDLYDWLFETSEVKEPKKKSDESLIDELLNILN